MNEADVATQLREMMMVTAKLGGPPLVVALAVGFLVSLVQALTQVNEATLVFVPKVLALGGCFVLLFPFMLATLGDYTRGLMDQLVVVGGR